MLCALGFLTRLPTPRWAYDEPEVARSAGFFAAVGLLLGGLLWGSARLVAPLGAPLGSVLVVTFWTVITGAFHLDGLADTVDGFSGGRGDRERTLAIMRDSRIGSHGACALILALALKAAGLQRAEQLGVELVWLVPVVARFACTTLLAAFPYARTSGVGSAFSGRVGVRELAWGALGLAAPLLLPAARDLRYALLVVGGLAASWSVAWWARARLGGLTGDVHGAAIEAAEIGGLLVLCAIPLR
jgi:adenosylcobinamide-GDP ribazoletransferase